NLRMTWRKYTGIAVPLLIMMVLLCGSVVSLANPLDQARLFTADIEYDYIAWLANAAGQKASQALLNPVQRLPQEQQTRLVKRYFALVQELEIVQARVEMVYADPAISDASAAAAELLRQQHALQQSLDGLSPLVEAILQFQVASVMADEGIGFLAQPLPPVLFHSSPLPKALIVSPRDSIRQEVNISLLADLGLEDITRLEENVSSYMNASALVVDVGGIGVYPTMVQRSSNIEWTLDTIAHEWTHNYLTLHPLGWNYDTTAELRTMNETAASIVGKEISREVMRRYYADDDTGENKTPKAWLKRTAVNEFDFRQEMHKTRVRVDELLAQGKVEEAEEYMEQRRVVFVEHGYMIRKLNQAYFAFHGAYADMPGGAAGEDPVGPAVRALREQAGSLALFLRRIAWMNSFTDLQKALAH
ncbi:MAG TPA: hypothetical protein PKZ26_07130, partial [Anaerolineaceae bacterium]|nr:hypothetical protein [Anaerolineaceae bacterium]